MDKNTPKLQWVLFAAILSLAASCVTGHRLDLRSAEETQVSGNYRLILYGCTHFNDLETLAVLDKEEDPYTFEPFAPDFNYRVKKGLTAEEALTEAEKFVDCHTAFRRHQLAGLVDAKGETLGFEVRPLYMPFVFGTEDVIRTDYRVKGDKVIVRVRLSESAEGEREDGSSRGREH